MKTETRATMKAYLEVFIQTVIDKYKPQVKPTAKRKFVDFGDQGIAQEYLRKGSYKPFHLALLPIEVVRISAFVNGFETSLGNAFEECAKLLALERYRVVKRGYKFEGEVYSDSLIQIEKLISDVGSRKIKNEYPKLIRQVINARGNKIPRPMTVDLFFQDEHGDEHYFEIKGPKPNKGQALEVTQRLLLVHALRHKAPPKVQTHYAMAYNPYGKDEYKHSISLGYLDMNDQVLLGKRFWDLVGGVNAYQELLELCMEIREEKGKDIIDHLAFDLS